MPGIAEEKKRLDERMQKLLLKEKILREREKKQEAKRLDEIGRLVSQASIDILENDILFGAFLEIALLKNESGKVEKWKKLAQEFKEPKKDDNASAITVVFNDTPNKEVVNILKKLGFRWNRFREEYYGYGEKENIRNALSGIDCQISEIQST